MMIVSSVTNESVTNESVIRGSATKELVIEESEVKFVGQEQRLPHLALASRIEGTISLNR